MPKEPNNLAGCPIVVIVEDDIGQARLTQRALQALGLTSRIEGTGAACRTAIAEEHDCVVLLDLGLPDVAEFELLTELVESERQIPLIVVTGNDDLTVAIEALRRGAWDYVVKRPDLSHLNELSYVIERNLERRALMQERNLFRSMVSHDIRNPLNIIYNYADILACEETEISESSSELIERIKDNALTTLDLVSNFVEMDRIDSGRLTLEREAVDVPALIEKVLRRHRPMAASKEVTLNLDLQSETAEAFADRAYLERVITNLISNAIKFTPSGGELTVHVSVDGDQVRIKFEDTGCGVSADECKSIFDKYSRAKTTKTIDGTGLGLYIARSVLEAHGGSIELKSEVGVGSIFDVTLPKVQATVLPAAERKSA